MLQVQSSIPLRAFTDQSPSPFTFFPSPLPQLLFPRTAKPSKFVIRNSATEVPETLPKSAIQRIADKLRSLGFTEESPTRTGTQVSELNQTLSPGEIFIPLPKQLPKHRVGHTIDTSWSTPENPVPDPGTGGAIVRFHELKREVDKRRRNSEKEKRDVERVPTLAELSLPEEELERLKVAGIGLKNKLKVGKAGITEGIVNSIHEHWRRSEVVKIVCEDISRMNMKRTHDVLERKTGGMVVWRSGSKIVLYRGINYKYPYFYSDEVIEKDSSHHGMEEHGKMESRSSSHNGTELAGYSSTDKMAYPSLIQGVGCSNRVRFELPGETELAEEADRLLEGLGPRFTDWWGYDPLPIDADLLPAVLPGYRKPFRLLPFGVKSKLTDDEMTTLRRLARPLPCHFALGRNRKLQGLAASIVKLWEECEIAKVAVKRGVQNTNSELMAEELRWLTGGTLLSRDREFITLYRGKDFLPFAVSSAIEAQRNYGMLQDKQRKRENSSLPKAAEEVRPQTTESGPKSEPDNIGKPKTVPPCEKRKPVSTRVYVKRTSVKLSMALEKKANAEKLLADLEKEETLQQPEMDKEGITEEERYMLTKIGLKMKPFLLLGRRGVFDGTVENMHLHWKYRELVKIISNERSKATVHQVARTLEAESGGILVAVERVNKGYAIIVYRGKNYIRPSSLRPQTLLNKKEALKRSIEAQRRKSLKLHVLKLTKNIEELKLQLDKDGDTISTEPVAESKSQLSTNKLEEPSTSINAHNIMGTSINSQGSIQQDSFIDDDHLNKEVPGFSSSSLSKGTHASISYMDTEAGSVDTRFDSVESPSEGMNSRAVLDDQETNASKDIMNTSVKLDERELDLSHPLMVENQPNEIPSRAIKLTNKERLLLRKQALRLKKRPVLAIGRSNIVSGVAKAIKTHFQKHPLAIVNVKGRAKGTSVQEVVFKLEQATGAVMVSQEPSKVILYRGWGGGDKPGPTTKKNGTEKETEGGSQPMVSPELLAAIRLECGL